MLYLATQFAWFLLAAFVIGLVFGWLTGRGGPRGLASGPLVGLAIFWAALAGLAWFRLVNDQAAFWAETALLHLLAYAGGYLVGSLFAAESEAVPALLPPAPRLALPQPAPSLPAPAEAAVIEDTVSATKPEGAGRRPGNLLPAARGGKPDDLALIGGIDQATADKLNALGLWHFDQIAALDADELRFVADHAAVSGSDAAARWKAEAEVLARNAATGPRRTTAAKRSRKKR